MPAKVAARNTGDPSGTEPEFMLRANGSRRTGPPGSQSVHSSASNAGKPGEDCSSPAAKAGNDRWSEGTQEDGCEMNGPEEQRPATVAVTPTQAGEALRQKWHWVEPSVWTDRMLTALENGVKGNKWFSLSDKVESERNLRSAFDKVWRNGGSPGADGQRVESFEHHLEMELAKLGGELHEGRYRPQPARRVYIPKPGSPEKRSLGIPAVRDRVVQGALRHVLEPIFEREFGEQSYGFRPGRSCHDALRRVEGLLKEGHTWVVDADLKSYFDTIPHERLMERIRERVSDGKVLALIASYLRTGVLEEMNGWQPTAEGTPQGAVISPLLANLYLNPLDHLMSRKGFEMIRYADDFVILCRSQAEAEEALAQVQQWVNEAGLTLHPEKTRLVDATQRGGFDFLGYHFERGMKWPRQKSLQKLKDKLRPLTKRQNGRSLEETMARIKPILRGWFGYFRYSKRTTFEAIDGWVRGRLRSILRKRSKRKGRAKGRDHQRWPNRYFEQHGFYSLVEAVKVFRQSRV
jgi:RNA-directed DNA polymerase